MPHYLFSSKNSSSTFKICKLRSHMYIRACLSCAMSGLQVISTFNKWYLMAIEAINVIGTAVGPAGVRWCQLYVRKNKAHTVYIQTNIPSTISSSKIKGMSNGLWNIWELDLICPTYSPRTPGNVKRKYEGTMTSYKSYHHNPLREQNENVLRCCQDTNLQHQQTVFSHVCYSRHSSIDYW